eukprot:752938-Hanusia_phi.AAC.10
MPVSRGSQRFAVIRRWKFCNEQRLQTAQMGSVIEICVEVQDSYSSNQRSSKTANECLITRTLRCFPVDVLPCVYCTKPQETLLSIARVFQTDWYARALTFRLVMLARLQIWSANINGTRFPSSMRGITPWEAPGPFGRQVEKLVDQLPANVAIRLGPVYTPAVDTAISWLLWDFQVRPVSPTLFDDRLADEQYDTVLGQPKSRQEDNHDPSRVKVVCSATDLLKLLFLTRGWSMYE